MYTLIIFIYAGILAKGDSVALDHVPGFETKAACEQAGAATKKFVKGTAKEHEYVCVPMKG